MTSTIPNTVSTQNIESIHSSATKMEDCQTNASDSRTAESNDSPTSYYDQKNILKQPGLLLQVERTAASSTSPVWHMF